jgi:DNA-binding transcriptional LysR family regulator
VTLYAQALEMLQALQNTRAMLRGHNAVGKDFIQFAVPHTLAFTFFPAWMAALRESFGPIKSRLSALNVHDAAMRMAEGGCDVLIAYHHPSLPLQIDPERYDMVVLGHEVLAPYAPTRPDGRALFSLPGLAAKPLPYLGYAPGAYLGEITDWILKQAGTPVHLERVYETDMAEGLKVMALEGHGVAFLPRSAVKKEVQAGALVEVTLPEGQALALNMEVRAYREKPLAKSPMTGPAQMLWRHLTQRHGSVHSSR